MSIGEHATPLGPMLSVATAAGLTLLEFADRPGLSCQLPRPGSSAAHAHLARLDEELGGYFTSRLRRFTVPIAPSAGTPFQRSAWDYLRTIPFGQTRTYGQQAAGLGAPTASRAVGRANGSNPICLLVPCHRVVGAAGHLTGYAGGIDRKRWLLDHERSAATLFA